MVALSTESIDPLSTLRSLHRMTTRFCADLMLGRLARMLRLLGYDTEYSNEVTAARLLEIARGGERVVLTRGLVERRFPGLANVYSVRSEHPPEQLREVVGQFQLDVRSGLWTRCTLCNGLIEKTGKGSVEGSVPPKVFEAYEEFFRCIACQHIYWRGSHVEKALKNLAAILANGV